MKKLFLLSILMSTLSYSQITDENGNSAADSGNTTLFGNIGIGVTPSANSEHKLEVNGAVQAKRGIFGNSLPDGSTFVDGADRNLKCSVLNAGTQFGPSGYILNVLDFPQSNINPQAQSFIGMEDRNYKSRWRFYANTGGLSELLYYNKNQSAFYSLREDGNDNVHLKLPKLNSYLTIGTGSFSDNGDLYKLTVNGKVRAHAVKVYTDWADFVFKKDYELPTIQDVEDYIKKNGHLKDIPSTKEVEEKGIELGEMNKLLLQKIEELTLYTIQLKKEIDELKTK